MADNEFDLCSTALGRVGCKAITSFTQLTTESNVAGREYERLVATLMSGTPRYRFCTAQVELNKLAEVPKARWSYYYQLPPNVLEIHTITHGDVPIDYDRHADKIACDVDGLLVLDHSVRVDEENWPSQFKEGVICKLASIFAAGIRRDVKMADLWAGEAEAAFAKVRVADSQQKPTRQIGRSRLTGIRR
jgi:hypothetical protein